MMIGPNLHLSYAAVCEFLSRKSCLVIYIARIIHRNGNELAFYKQSKTTTKRNITSVLTSFIHNVYCVVMLSHANMS